MDKEKIKQSFKPVKEIVTADIAAQNLAGETKLQKLFDNRKGPSVGGSPQIDYHVFSPTKTAGAKYPVFIWLHGMGDGSCFREPLRRWPISNFASPEYQAKFTGGGAYIVVPRANEDLGMMATGDYYFYTKSWISGENFDDDYPPQSQVPELTAAIRQFLNEERENVDLSQVYLAGYSAGGYMTWQTILAMPDIFAAAAPICHARIVPTHEQMQTVKNIPLWVICGEKDYLYPQFVAPTIENLRKTHGADLRTTIFEDVYNPDYSLAPSQHASWVPVTNNMFYNDGKPYDQNYPEGFIAWLNQHSK